MPSASPSATSKLTTCTTRDGARADGKVTLRSRTESRVVKIPPAARVESVAQTITQKIQAHQHDRHETAGAISSTGCTEIASAPWRRAHPAMTLEAAPRVPRKLRNASPGMIEGIVSVA